jgi:transposase
MVAGTMQPSTPQIIELDQQRLRTLIERAEKGALEPEDYPLVKSLALSYQELWNTLRDKNISIGRLRKLLFGPSTEKTEQLGSQHETNAGNEPPSSVGEAPPPGGGNPPCAPEGEPCTSSIPAEPPTEKPPAVKKPGHGRNGAEDYPGADRVRIRHASLQQGDGCPECGKGTLYRTGDPRVLIRLVGDAPIKATVYELEKLRCHLCGKVVAAEAPPEAGDEKYDATVPSMIALLKYGAGMPFHRQEQLQNHLGVPLPASTQWEIVSTAAETLLPVFEELIDQAAQGDVVHNDDTRARILEFMGKRRAKEEPPSEHSQGDARSGLFTSGIVSRIGERTIGVFVTGKQHAGENLRDMLRRRAESRGPPIQMCDALSRNTPEALQTIVANCLAHGRRQFVDIYEVFPEECRYVLEALRVVYHNDALAHEQRLSPEERLSFHQAESGPTMDDLKKWLERQLQERLVEPNSPLGAAMKYLLNHWAKLTLFLRKAGAPLDNNICERALKKAIRHRKNSLFYKTLHGAAVGDLYMSLIHTCELNGVNPLNYLTELLRHGDELAKDTAKWMPWNYRRNLLAAA